MTDTFLLVSGRHVGAHPDGHQHRGSIQISINLGKKFLRISCIRKNCYDLKLGESLCIFTFFLFSESGLYQLNGFDFYFDWRDTENQQLIPNVTYPFHITQPLKGHLQSSVTAKPSKRTVKK